MPGVVVVIIIVVIVVVFVGVVVFVVVLMFLLTANIKQLILTVVNKYPGVRFHYFLFNRPLVKIFTAAIIIK